MCVGSSPLARKHRHGDFEVHHYRIVSLRIMRMQSNNKSPRVRSFGNEGMGAVVHVVDTHVVVAAVLVSVNLPAPDSHSHPQALRRMVVADEIGERLTKGIRPPEDS